MLWKRSCSPYFYILPFIYCGFLTLVVDLLGSLGVEKWCKGNSSNGAEGKQEKCLSSPSEIFLNLEQIQRRFNGVQSFLATAIAGRSYISKIIHFCNKCIAEYKFWGLLIKIFKCAASKLIAEEITAFWLAIHDYLMHTIMAFFMCSMLTALLTYFCYIEKCSIQ